MDFELAKVLASVGGFVAAAGVVTHWALVIVGAVLLYLGLSAYVEREGDQSAKNNVLYWLIYVVFASVAYAAAHAARIGAAALHCAVADEKTTASRTKGAT
ncbi:MAG: hypothetical protein QXP31_00210 [Pyrobaculum sp.]